MKMTHFESRQPLIVHQIIVGVAFGTYFVQRDDIVWQFVKNTTHPAVLERISFAVATTLVGVAAIVCTRSAITARPFRQATQLPATYDRSSPYGELLYAIGLGSLTPLSGFLILVAGEGLRVFRLTTHRRELLHAPSLPANEVPVNDAGPGCWHGLVMQLPKWGMLMTMVVFTITLKDRVAEVLASVVFLGAIALNFLCTPRIDG